MGIILRSACRPNDVRLQASSNACIRVLKRGGVQETTNPKSRRLFTAKFCTTPARDRCWHLGCDDGSNVAQAPQQAPAMVMLCITPSDLQCSQQSARVGSSWSEDDRLEGERVSEHQRSASRLSLSLSLYARALSLHEATPNVLDQARSVWSIGFLFRTPCTTRKQQLRNKIRNSLVLEHISRRVMLSHSQTSPYVGAGFIKNLRWNGDFVRCFGLHWLAVVQSFTLCRLSIRTSQRPSGLCFPGSLIVWGGESWQFRDRWCALSEAFVVPVLILQ